MLGKLVAVLVILVLLFVTFFKPMYHVSAQFEFAPQSKFTLCAPYDGRITHIGTLPNGQRIRPGDQVKAGTVLLELETYDQKMKLAESLAKVNSKVREAAKYRAEDKTAEEEMALDERDEAQAESDYLQYQIDHATIVAPKDSQVLKGDFEEKQNATVKTGDVLFELGDPHDLRAVLSVPDRDIQELKIGQEGKVATSALPDSHFPIRINRIIPIPDPKEGTNTFRVYAALEGTRPRTWLPGMSGEARVNVEHRRLVWIWTHRLVDFLKLKLWM